MSFLLERDSMFYDYTTSGSYIYYDEDKNTCIATFRITFFDIGKKVDEYVEIKLDVYTQKHYKSSLRLFDSNKYDDSPICNINMIKKRVNDYKEFEKTYREKCRRGFKKLAEPVYNNFLFAYNRTLQLCKGKKNTFYFGS